MPTIPRARIRLACDVSRIAKVPLDVRTQAEPGFFTTADLQIEIGVFDNGVLQSVANLASIEVQVRPYLAPGVPPTGGEDAVMAKGVASFDNSLDLTTWNDGSKQHALITFAPEEGTILPPGKYWLSIYATTTDAPGRNIPLAAGPLRVFLLGAGPVPEPPNLIDVFLTAAQCEAMFMPKSGALTRETVADFSAAGNSSITIPAGSRVHSVQAAALAGAGAYTRGLIVPLVDRVAGDLLFIHLALAQSDNPSVEVKLNAIGPPPLTTFNGAATAARHAFLALEYTGASWQVLLAHNPGTAVNRDVAPTGNANATQVVKGDDTRLSDSRAPTAHTHPQSEVTNLVSDLAGKAAAAHAHAQADVTSLVSDLAPPPAGPFLSSGGAAAALVIPDGNAWTFGTDDFSLGLCLLQPDWTPAANVVLAQKVNGNEGWKLWLLTTGVLRLELGNGTNFSTYRYDSTAAITTISGVTDFRAAHLALSADRDGNLLFAVNGVPLGAAVSLSASAAQTLTTTGAVHILSDGTTHYPGRVHRLVPFNVALPLSDATWRFDLARLTRGFALPQAMRYGEAGDYYAANAPANAATNGAADANNTTGWTNIGTWVCGAQAGARDGGAGAYVLRITSGATPSSGVITAAVGRVHRSGQRLRVSFWARRSASAQATIPFYIRAGSGSTLMHTFTGLTTNWQLFTTLLTVPEGDSTRNEMGLGMSAGIAQNEYLEIDDFQLTAQGALALYDPPSLNPCQWRDWGTNQAHSDIFPTTVQVLDFPPGGDFVVTRRFVAGTSEPSSTAATTPLLRLPPHAALLAFHSKSAVGYDASTTFDIGITGTQAKFASAINVAATTETYTPSLSLGKESRSAFTAVWIKRNQSVTVGDTTIDTFCRMAGGPLL